MKHRTRINVEVVLLVLAIVLGTSFFAYASETEKEKELKKAEDIRLSHLGYNISYMDKYAGDYYALLKAGKQDKAEATLTSWQYHLDAAYRFLTERDKEAEEKIGRLAVSLEYNLQIHSLDKYFPGQTDKLNQALGLASYGYLDKAEAKLCELIRDLNSFKDGQTNKAKKKVLEYFLGIEDKLRLVLVCRNEYYGQIPLIKKLANKIIKDKLPEALKINNKLTIALNMIKEKIPQEHLYLFNVLESKILFLVLQRGRLENYLLLFGESMDV